MSFSKQLKLLLHPYVFVLKEGKGFSKDSMSYDLMMLQVNNEVIKSPANAPAKDHAQEDLEMLKTALPRAIERIRGVEAS